MGVPGAANLDPVGPLDAEWLGREAFAPCLERQLERREAILAGNARERLYFVEHPATLTLGRRGTRADILWSDELLAAAGVAVAETPRGGEVTLHAPGQLVVYPIVRIGRAIRAHIVALGEATSRWCASEGLEGCEFRMEVPGVWRGERKLASIGVHVSRGIAVQGLSINIAPEPRLFGALVSCGMPQVEMTSVVRELREDGAVARAEALAARPLADVATSWAAHYAAHVGRGLRWLGPGAGRHRASARDRPARPARSSLGGCVARTSRRPHVASPGRPVVLVA